MKYISGPTSYLIVGGKNEIFYIFTYPYANLMSRKVEINNILV
jgi:hypothetical protein